MIRIPGEKSRWQRRHCQWLDINHLENFFVWCHTRRVFLFSKIHRISVRRFFVPLVDQTSGVMLFPPFMLQWAFFANADESSTASKKLTCLSSSVSFLSRISKIHHESEIPNETIADTPEKSENGRYDFRLQGENEERKGR